MQTLVNIAFGAALAITALLAVGPEAKDAKMHI